MHRSNYWTFIQFCDRFTEKASSDFLKEFCKGCMFNCRWDN